LKTSENKIVGDSPDFIINISERNASENENLRLRKDAFLRKAIKLHCGKYDYSEFDYISSRIAGRVKCQLHGIFHQSPEKHLMGRGCPKCGYKKQSISKHYTTDQFIRMATKCHKHKYIYSATNYVESELEVDILCPTHGIFRQSPASHLTGRGCPICANEFTSNKLRLSNEDFIAKANIRHGNKYDYSNVDYACNGRTNVTIICPAHGKFQQRPNNHLIGRGCPKCGNERQNGSNQFLWKNYTFPNGRIEKTQGYEPWTLDYLLSSGICDSDIIIRGRPIITYNVHNVSRRYFPDCYLKTSNTLVETKSVWTWNSKKKETLAKIKGAIKCGYNIRVIIWDSAHHIVSDKTYGTIQNIP